MRRIVGNTLIVIAAVLCWVATAPAAEQALRLNLAKSTLQITTFYNGQTLEATGTVPADADVVIEVSGPKKAVHLKEKGKVAGFLWMNKTDVSLENTPAVYMVYTPANGDRLLTPELGVGYKALVKDIEIEPASEDKAFVFGEYVKLMEKWGVYAVHEGSISYDTPKDGVKTFKATLVIPPKMNAGSYQVRAVAVKNGAVTGTDEQQLAIELTGFPKVIASLAFGKPLLFGIMAVVIAIATGLIIGALFKGGGGAH